MAFLSLERSTWGQRHRWVKLWVVLRLPKLRMGLISGLICRDQAMKIRLGIIEVLYRLVLSERFLLGVIFLLLLVLR